MERKDNYITEQDKQDIQDIVDMDFDGETTRPTYTGPKLMTDEYCLSPHFLASFEETQAWKYAMAERCVQEGREVVFVRNLKADDVDIVSTDGREESHTPWNSPKGEHLRFTAEARNPKTGNWEMKTFHILTAERSAMVDGKIIIEGTKSNGTPYTISAQDFAEEFNSELKRNGLSPIGYNELEKQETQQVENEQPTQEMNDEEFLKMIGVETKDASEEYTREIDASEGVDLFKSVESWKDPRPYYDDVEYGRIY